VTPRGNRRISANRLSRRPVLFRRERIRLLRLSPMEGRDDQKSHEIGSVVRARFAHLSSAAKPRLCCQGRVVRLKRCQASSPTNIRKQERPA
jgi:hypothetical protein